MFRGKTLIRHIPACDGKSHSSKSTQHFLRAYGCINTNGMHHQLLKVGLKNDPCIREWLERKKRDKRDRQRTEERRCQ